MKRGYVDMSKYTTELRFICETESGLKESVGYNDIERIIGLAREKIFNFDYPIFDEQYRPTLETKILKHFYTREIGLETYGLWKLKLNTKLNEIMPFYNQLYKSQLLEFNPFYTKNLTIDYNKKNKDDTQSDSSTGTNANSTGWNLFSDTPQGSLQNIDNQTYLTNATKNMNNSSNNGTTNTKIGATGNEDYLEHIVGYEGKDASLMLLNYRKTFLNIDMQVINDLEDLFMGLW